MGDTVTLTDWALTTTYDDLPETVISAVRRSIVDSIGVMAAGSRHEAVTILAEMLDDAYGPTPEAGHLVLGRPHRAGILNATLLNGTSAHVLDFDDTILPTRCHISAPLLSALVATAERTGATGKDLITAFAIGFELVTRGADAVYRGNEGWHGTGVMGPLGVAVATGRLLGLDALQTRHALALAANQASGLRSSFGSEAKSWNLGRAGANGLHAALLAERGFTGGEKTLDAGGGFLHLLSDEPEQDILTHELGTTWAVERNGFKPYPCGFVAHAAIDGTLAARRTNLRDPESIVAIRLQVAPETMKLTGNRVPTTGLEAKFSVFHAVAGAYLDGHVSVETFSDQLAVDEAHRTLAAKVEAIPVATYRQGEATVEVETVDGTDTAYVENALGTPANPMSDENLEDKFVRLSTPLWGEPRARQVVQHLWTLEEHAAADVIALLDLP